MNKHSRSLALLSVAWLAAEPASAWAHAFPKSAEPAIGATVSAAPGEVKVWFTQKLEPAFSKIEVRDAAGADVAAGDGAVDAEDATLLHRALKPLQAGVYTVHWHAVSVDTHATDGDFTFTMK